MSAGFGGSSYSTVNAIPRPWARSRSGRFFRPSPPRRRSLPRHRTRPWQRLLFLYQEVLRHELPWVGDLVHAKRPAHVPVVLTPAEAVTLLAGLTGPTALVGSLLYGAGLRLLEALRLRVKDIDFERREIVVRRGKGQKDRHTVLPGKLVDPLRGHLELVRARHGADVEEGCGFVELPEALRRKYPSAPKEWPWQWVFPATRTYIDAGHRRDPSPPPSRDGGSKRDPPSRRRRQNSQARHAPHPPPLLRDSPLGIRLRHPHDPRAPRSQGRQHHDDLHPRPESRRRWRSQPPRSLTSLRPSPYLSRPWPRPLSDYPARPCVASSRDRDGPVVQDGREIAVAKDYPTVENTSSRQPTVQ